MLALAPSRMASSPAPESPTETVPVVTRSALGPETVTMPAPLAPMPASSVVAVTVAPLVTESWPVAAAPTCNAPAIWRLALGPVTETEEPPAVDWAAMAAAATDRVLPSSISRVADWLEPKTAVSDAATFAPEARCQAPAAINSAATDPVPMMPPPAPSNTTVSVTLGTQVAGTNPSVVSFQLDALENAVPVAPVQTSVLGFSTAVAINLGFSAWQKIEDEEMEFMIDLMDTLNT